MKLTKNLLWAIYHEMTPGTSFLLDTNNQRDHALTVARRIGVKATSWKVHGKGFRIQLCEQ